MFSIFVLSLLTLCGPVLAQLPSWNTITYQESQRNVTMRITKPPDNIVCPVDPRMTCRFTLNISSMLTMTLYPYDSSDVNYAGGWRYLFGYAAKVNPDGSFSFLYENALDDALSPSPFREFLWPVVGDGTRRSVLTINNRMPAPTIITRKNQKVEITVVNSLLTDSISIHWHGLHANGTPWMDGVPQISQCPILPGTNFTYEFTVHEVGTHWYHSHNGGLRTDGLFGAIVVTSDDEFEGTGVIPSAFEDNPEQHTFTLFDWQHLPSSEVFHIYQSQAGFDSPGFGNIEKYEDTHTPGWSEAGPVPFQSGLINMAGWFFQPPSSSTCTPQANLPLSIFEVQRGKTYRFRAVSAASMFSFRLSIQGHKLILLATDGVPTKTNPEKVDFIIIHSAETYDFLLMATPESKTDGYYWMVGETLESLETLYESGINCTIGRRSYAIVKYSDAADMTTWPPTIDYDPNTDRTCYSSNSCYALNCPFQSYPPGSGTTCINVDAYQLRRPQPIPDSDVSDTMFLNFAFDPIVGSSINGRHFASPPSPPVVQLNDLSVEGNMGDFCEYTQEPHGLGRKCTHTLTTSNSATVEIVLMNLFSTDTPLGDIEAHVVHLHGHYFRVVHMGWGNCSSNSADAICTHDDIICDDPEGLCFSQVRWANGGDHWNRTNKFAPLKDTVILPSGAYVVIRFEADNPGWWFLHCHLQMHQLSGMAMVVAENIDKMPTPPDSLTMCGNVPFRSTRRATDAPPCTGGPGGIQGFYFPPFVALLGVSIILLLTILCIILGCCCCYCRENGCCGLKLSRTVYFKLNESYVNRQVELS